MLVRLFEQEPSDFTVHEIGCALGHFGDFLRERFPNAIFSGSDVVEDFVSASRRRHPGSEFFLRDITDELPADRYDYVVAVGIFNIPGNTPRDRWQVFAYSMLRAMYALAEKGIGATMLTHYYDPGKEREDLFYQDEKALMDFTVSDLSRHFEIDSAGPLYEYALRAYRPDYVRERYQEAAFSKYFRQE